MWKVPALCLFASLTLLGCTKGPIDQKEPEDTVVDDDTSTDSEIEPDEVPDISDALYTTDRLIEVEIEVAAEDWELLVHQKRNIMDIARGDCLAAPWPNPYTWFPARVVVEGQEVENAAVRKKGLIGSESSTKPSLKLSFDKYEENLTVFGLDELTLNNARQDASYIRQCLGYELFTAAGVPSSRCGFAHVVVNGEDLGIYVNVEPVDKDFLRRHYEDPDGNLYEGRLSDFRDEWLGSFELKTNEEEADRGDLQALADALEVDDAALLDAVDPLLDLDAFFTYWAMETLTGHWDSYSANMNNFLVYHHPANGRFYFHPWGIDSVVDNEEPFGAGMPQTVSAAAVLPYRLYLHPESQALYLDRLRTLLDSVWNEDALVAEVDRLATTVEPFISRADSRSWNAAVELTRDVIRGRRAVLEGELDKGPAEWDRELRGNPCFQEIGVLTGTFSGSWAEWDIEELGESTLTFEYLGVDYPVSNGGIIAATGDDGVAYIGVSGDLEWGSSILVYFMMDPEIVAPGSFPIDWASVTSYLYYREPTTDWGLAAYVWGGSLELDQAGVRSGDPLVGTFSSLMWGGTE